MPRSLLPATDSPPLRTEGHRVRHALGFFGGMRAWILRVLIALAALALGCGSRTELEVDLAGPQPASTSSAQACTPESGLTVLASTSTPLHAVGGFNVAVDATSVYWVSAEADPSLASLMKVPLCGGGGATVLVSGSVGATFAVDSEFVYWVSTGPTPLSQVMKLPIAGGSSTVLASNQAPSAIAVDATNVYWTDAGLGTVVSVPRGGGTPVPLTPRIGAPFQGLALDATTAYFSADQFGLVAAPLAGGISQTLGVGPATGPVFVFGGMVYWGSVGTASGSVAATPVTGGSLTPLVVEPGPIGGFVVDDSNVYWTTLTCTCCTATGCRGTLKKKKAILEGETPATTLVSGWNAAPSPSFGVSGVTLDAMVPMAVDATSVYWASGNTVYRFTPK